MNITLVYLTLGAILMGIGVFMVLTKTHNIMILMGIELIFNAANINLVAFSKYNHKIDGQVYVLFVILIAACEAAVGLAIILQAYRYFRTIEAAKINELKD